MNRVFHGVPQFFHCLARHKVSLAALHRPTQSPREEIAFAERSTIPTFSAYSSAFTGLRPPQFPRLFATPRASETFVPPHGSPDFLQVGRMRCGQRDAIGAPFAISMRPPKSFREGRQSPAWQLSFDFQERTEANPLPSACLMLSCLIL